MLNVAMSLLHFLIKMPTIAFMNDVVMSATSDGPCVPIAVSVQGFQLLRGQIKPRATTLWHFVCWNLRCKIAKPYDMNGWLENGTYFIGRKTDVTRTFSSDERFAFLYFNADQIRYCE